MIATIGLGRLSNALHFELMTEFDISIATEGYTSHHLDVEVPYMAFKSALSVEDSAMKNVKSSVITKEIAHANQQRNSYYTGMHYSVLGAKYHYDPTVRSAAERIDVVLEQYGNPTRLNYKAETGILRSLVADLEGKLLSDMNLIGAAHWIEPLKQANLEVDSLIGNRTDEELAQSGVNMKEARTAIDPLYNALVTRINALAEVKGGELFTSFVNKHNARIAYFKKIIAQSGQRSKADEANKA